MGRVLLSSLAGALTGQAILLPFDFSLDACLFGLLVGFAAGAYMGRRELKKRAGE